VETLPEKYAAFTSAYPPGSGNIIKANLFVVMFLNERKHPFEGDIAPENTAFRGLRGGNRVGKEQGPKLVETALYFQSRVVGRLHTQLGHGGNLGGGVSTPILYRRGTARGGKKDGIVTGIVEKGVNKTAFNVWSGAEQGRVKPEAAKHTLNGTVFSGTAKMKLVAVDKNSIALGKGKKPAVHIIGHFSFKHDDEFKIAVPMAIRGISDKTGKIPDYGVYRQIGRGVLNIFRPILPQTQLNHYAFCGPLQEYDCYMRLSQNFSFGKASYDY
jgi:hypothetical protein